MKELLGCVYGVLTMARVGLAECRRQEEDDDEEMGEGGDEAMEEDGCSSPSSSVWVRIFFHHGLVGVTMSSWENDINRTLHANPYVREKFVMGLRKESFVSRTFCVTDVVSALSQCGSRLKHPIIRLLCGQ